MQNRTVLFLSLPLAALIIIVSVLGLLIPGFYSAETSNWQAQSIGQDMIDLFLITPCLLITSVLAYRNNRTASMIWGGIVLYLTYTFTIYCFDIHFNKLFVIYCLCLGLSFYSLVYFLFSHYKENSNRYSEKKSVARFIGIYFIIISVLFYFLWLSEIIPSTLQQTVPKSVTDAGLFTNAVHVLDLAVILPAIFITGIFLLSGKPLGFVLAPVFLTFFVLMDITIATLAVVIKMKGAESNLTITAIMSVLALFSLILLIWSIKSFRTIPGT